MAKIGVQMMIFKKQIEEIGTYEVMKKIKEIGYSYVEVSQVEMTEENVAGLKKATEDFGMTISALSAAVEASPMKPDGETLEKDFDKIVNDCKILNCDYLRVGMMPIAYMGSYELSLAFAKKCDEYAEKLDAHGIKLYYHNHHVEFTKYDGKYLLDILKDETNKIGFELDVHWVYRGGENPVDFIKKYKGKVELLHLKDYKIAPLDTSKLGTDRKAFGEAWNGVVRFAEIFDGSLDFDGIIAAGLDADVKFMIIEQDDTYGEDPFVCLARSKANLVAHGYGDMF